MTPRLAIVIPIFRHSALVHEAIDCALSLDGPMDTVVIAVDDGCPHDETRAALEAWAQMEPQRFHHLHQANRGLSGARNTGISFALRRYPSLEAIYPLDSDNRLDAHSLHLFDHLLASHPEVDWFYPNFDMFGLNTNEHNGGPFSLAQLAESNACEAGSLIRRRVLDAGIRFDETMRAGYEDWEFWLSASGAGFRGMPVRQSFFRYRKRPESMLSGSHGSDENLRAEIKKRHQWLYSKDNVAQFAAQQAPRFVEFETGPDAVIHAFTDPRNSTETELGAALLSITTAAIRPNQTPRPMTWVFARPGVRDALNEMKLGASAYWHMHAAAMGADIAALRVVRHADGRREIVSRAPIQHPRHGNDWGTMSPRSRELAKERFAADRLSQLEALRSADILLLRAETVIALSNPSAEETGGDPARLATHIESLRIARVEVAVEDPPELPAAPDETPVEAMTKAVAQILRRRGEGNYLSRLAPWRKPPHISGPANLHWILNNQHLGSLPFPVLRAAGDYHIGFVLPIFLFGGVEKCVVALAAALKRQGVKCHLFIYGTGGMTGTDWLIEPFETVHQLTEPVLRDWGGRAYMGTNMATEPDKGLLSNMMAALTGMDAVVVSGCAAAYYGFSALRSKGIKTLTYEHLLERDEYGRTYGTPYLAVAYEGGIDRILTCSNQMSDWLHGQGVPWEKLLALPNGPGFPMAPEAISAALATRRERAADAPLRVGFLGRLDAQKGADRYIQVAERCRDLPIEFSITGSSVLGDAGLTVPAFITRHPAAFGREELETAFGRLDILLMPSRDEGLPLTIMEAQRVGVIPVATDVGAVAEAIEDGVDGFLITGEDVVGQMSQLLEKLARDPQMRHQVSARASAGESIWDANACRLLSALRPEVLAAE